LPDELRIEEGLSPDTVWLPEKMCYRVVRKVAMGASQSILIKNGVMYGGADPRRLTALAAGY
jgi:gamma-glutamyltranspeptidase/glutathione hydrolase